MCEICDLYHQFEEREMPKTVTVSYAIQVPDGYELDSDRPVPVENSDQKYLSTCGDAVMGCNTLGGYRFRLRPIATEQTWERPEWLSPLVQRIKWDEMCGWMVSGGNRVWEVLHVGPFLSRAAIEQLPSIEGIPPADRIWRIVERGEG